MGFCVDSHHKTMWWASLWIPVSQEMCAWLSGSRRARDEIQEEETPDCGPSVA